MIDKIPYLSFGTKNEAVFLHGNGFPPEAYTALLKKLAEKLKIYAMYQKPFSKTIMTPNAIYGWDVFKNDFIQFLKETKLKKPVAIGHSMGAIILLMVEIQQPGTFKKIFLLDPVITSPVKSRVYKIMLNMGLIDMFHPMIKKTKKRKMKYNSKLEMFDSYRNKKIFSKISDENLMCYIDSITIKHKNYIKIKLTKDWENAIYRNGSMNDYKIWRDIKKIKTPTYVITPIDREFGDFHYGFKLKKQNNLFQNIEIKDSTHLFPLERPKDVQNIIFNNLE